jgi:predicted Zn-dependent peptidase
MLAFIACLLATQVPIDQPSRLRTILPNGAAIVVENVPGAKSLSVQLFVSSRGTEETPITNGLRHLLEHIIARGPKGDLDQRLETAGGFLTAETSRDAMIFRLNLPPGQLGLGIKCVEELMHMPVVTPEMIQHEALILEQEAALKDDESKFSAAAWTQAYGDKGLDPLGNLDVIRNATPPMLDGIHRIQFVASNLVLAVAGDVDIDVATRACYTILSKAAKADVTGRERGTGSGGQTSVDVPGLAYSLPVPGLRMTLTAARLAAALALASEADGCYVIYTPSGNSGLITLGRAEDKAGLARVIRSAEPTELFERGQYLAKSWMARMLDTPEHIANIRGLLLVNGVDLKPDVLLENLKSMTYKQFEAAINAFKSNDVVVVSGR